MKQIGATGGVVVIGDLNIDAVVYGLSELPRMGAEILASDFRLTLGGSSAIFACGVAKLGLAVTFISKVGADDFGKRCLATLRQAGVSTRRISREKDLNTGVTISLSTRKDRALVTYLGAIAALGPEDVRKSAFRDSKHLHMSSYFLQAGLQSSFSQIFRDARKLGLTTSFDPNSDPTQVWDDGIREVFDCTDLLFLNQTEALQVTRARTVKAALKALGQKVPCVIIKLGAQGATAIKNGENSSAPGFSVDPIDTTGAGDSFAAGFVVSYLRGDSIVDCLDAGNACGALSTLQAGGTAGQPTRQALKRFLNEHRRAGYLA